MALSGSGLLAAGSIGDTAAVEHAAVWRDTAGVWTEEYLPQVDTRAYAVGVEVGTDDVFGTMLERPIWHAVRWHHDGTAWTRTLLRLPDSTVPDDVHSRVNAHGDGVSVGAISVSAGPWKAVIWGSADTIQELTGAGDHTEAYAHHGGVVVGVDSSGPRFIGFKWTAAAGREEIHPLAWDWSWPSGVDAAGRIVGVMGRGDPRDPQKDKAIFLLTP